MEHMLFTWYEPLRVNPKQSVPLPAAVSTGSVSLLFFVTHRVLLHSLGQLSGKQVLSATSDEWVKDEFSDLSEG